MNEYLLGIEKGQTICVSALHDKCRCHRCCDMRKTEVRKLKQAHNVQRKGERV